MPFLICYILFHRKIADHTELLAAKSHAILDASFETDLLPADKRAELYEPSEAERQVFKRTNRRRTKEERDERRQHLHEKIESIKRHLIFLDLLDLHHSNELKTLNILKRKCEILKKPSAADVYSLFESNSQTYDEY